LELWPTVLIRRKSAAPHLGLQVLDLLAEGRLPDADARRARVKFFSSATARK
jgi:hypothetical protein